MSQSKKITQERKRAFDDMLSVALSSLYHAATPNYPRGHFGPFVDEYDDWFAYEAMDAIDDLNREVNSDWPGRGRGILPLKVFEYGKFYTWGRGGRTVAPDGWMRGDHLCRGSDFDLNATERYELILAVRAFHDYVVEWNKGVSARWQDYTAERLAENEDHTENQAMD